MGRGNYLLFLILGYPGLTVPLPKSPPSGRGQWAPAPAHPLRYFWAERIEPCALPKSPLEPRRGFAQTLPSSSARTTLASPRTLGNDTPPPLPSPFPFPARRVGRGEIAHEILPGQIRGDSEANRACRAEYALRARPTKVKKVGKRLPPEKYILTFLGGEVNIYGDAAGVRAAEEKLLL